jgi:hypothetical protein
MLLEALEGLPLLGSGSEDADVHSGVAKIGGDVHGIDRDQRATGRDLAQNDRAQFTFEDFSHADQAVFHGNS